MRDADMCECCSKERFLLAGVKYSFREKQYMGRAVVVNMDGKHKIVSDLLVRDDDSDWFTVFPLDDRRTTEIKYCPMCGRRLAEPNEDWGD